MKIKTIMILTASEGHILTNGSLYLHKTFVDSEEAASAWSEVPEAEYEALKAARRASLEPATSSEGEASAEAEAPSDITEGGE